MVLELIAIGGVVYYYVRKNKVTKAKQAAFAAGQPWTNKDGTVTYPPNHANLPPYTPMATNMNMNTNNGMAMPPPPMSDYKRQNPQSTRSLAGPMSGSVSVPIQGQGQGQQEYSRGEYRDEKAPLVNETRAAMYMNEKL